MIRSIYASLLARLHAMDTYPSCTRIHTLQERGILQWVHISTTLDSRCCHTRRWKYVMTMLANTHLGFRWRLTKDMVCIRCWEAIRERGEIVKD